MRTGASSRVSSPATGTQRPSTASTWQGWASRKSSILGPQTWSSIATGCTHAALAGSAGAPGRPDAAAGRPPRCVRRAPLRDGDLPACARLHRALPRRIAPRRALLVADGEEQAARERLAEAAALARSLRQRTEEGAGEQEGDAAYHHRRRQQRLHQCHLAAPQRGDYGAERLDGGLRAVEQLAR